jgi:NADPH:quinone reductase-like Zn-dependent oxidoreductase
MKLRYKIMLGVLGLIVMAIGGLAMTLSYTSGCEAPPALEAGVTTMRAARARCYGPPDVVTVEEVEKPVPADDEVLVRVVAAAVNPLDYHYMRGSPYVLRLAAGIGTPTDPRVGVDFAGVVEATGNAVTRFAVGDEVFGGANGAFARYLTVREGGAIAKKPANVDFSEAASIGIAATTALQALRDLGKLEAGERVLINGASGGVGTFAVQMASSMEADVTGVCSTRNVDMVKLLGANRVIDYKTDDYTTLDDRYDVIIDNVGNHSPSTNHKLLNPGGRYVIVGGPKGNWIAPFSRPLQALWTSLFVDEELVTLFAQMRGDDMAALADMLADGRISATIDRSYPLDEVQEAIRYLETRRARGKVIIDLGGANSTDP